MREEIRVRLSKMSDTDYQKFSQALVPGDGRGIMLGVRLPKLRKYAKELSKGDWRKELSCQEDLYFEETMLRGMILGCACKDIEELFAYLRDFIPRVRNWSVCDSVCNGLKLAETCPEKTWDFLQPYLYSKEEFPVRVGLIMLLSHFIKLGEDGKKISRKRQITMEDLQGTEDRGLYTEKIFGVLDLLRGARPALRPRGVWRSCLSHIRCAPCGDCPSLDWTHLPGRKRYRRFGSPGSRLWR